MTVDAELPRQIPTSRIGIFYGYLVCLIAMGIALTGLNTVVSRAVDFSFSQSTVSPWRDATSDIASFNDYKQYVLEQRAERAQHLREKFNGTDNDDDHEATKATHTQNAELKPLLQDALRVPTDEELKSDYNNFIIRKRADEPALRRRALAEDRYNIIRNLLSGLQLFFTGAILFILHWRWVQRRIERVAPTPPPLFTGPVQDDTLFLQQQ